MKNSISIVRPGSPVEMYSDFFLLRVTEGQTIRQNLVGISDSWRRYGMGKGIDIYQFSGTLLKDQIATFESKYKLSLRASKCVSNNNYLKIAYKGRKLTGYMLSLKLSHTNNGADFSFNFIVTNAEHFNDMLDAELPTLSSRYMLDDIDKCYISYGEAEEADDFTGFFLSGLTKTYRERYQVGGLTTKDFKLTTFGGFPTFFSYTITIPEKEFIVQDIGMNILDTQDTLDRINGMVTPLISIGYNGILTEGYVTESVRNVGEGSSGMHVTFGLLVASITEMGLVEPAVEDGE